jgi:hypothetical protein
MKKETLIILGFAAIAGYLFLMKKASSTKISLPVSDSSLIDYSHASITAGEKADESILDNVLDSKINAEEYIQETAYAGMC